MKNYSLQDFKNIKAKNQHGIIKTLLILSAFLALYAIASTQEFNTLTKTQEKNQQAINALYEQDMKNEINLTNESIKILQEIDKHN